MRWGDVTFNHASQPTQLKIHLHVANATNLAREPTCLMAKLVTPSARSTRALHTWPSGVHPPVVSYPDPSPGPFFRTRDSKPLLKPKFVSEVGKALSTLGLPACDYAGHSFRIGAATAAAAAGIEDSTIQLLGRWNSAAFLSYIRTPRQQLVSASALISRIG